jgi:pimeloyl-ACP methyl ester carboxylesterase
MQDDGRHISIGERNLFALVRGSGPVVVLSGGADTAGVGRWGSIEQRLAPFATVVTYDRAGTGRSDPPPAAPSAADMVCDLRKLLAALSLGTPVVLVGLSLGALPVQLYACEYPSDVNGLVLLDPTPDLMLTSYYAPGSKAQRRSPSQATRLERERMPESCAQVRRAIEEERRMPDVPVVVLTAAVRADMGSAAGIAGDSLMMAHQHMAMRVPNGRLVVAEKSSHKTMISEQPELVVEAIKSILGDETRNPYGPGRY